MERIIVALSGSSGPHYGVRLLEVLGALEGVETHAIISAGARATIAYELERDPAWSRRSPMSSTTSAISRLRSRAAPTSPKGMVIAPCSIKTLSAMANSFNDNLIARAADVCLKERRSLVLVVRETPLHAGHLRLMAQATEMGAVILPPVPAFYHLPSRWPTSSTTPSPRFSTSSGSTRG